MRKGLALLLALMLLLTGCGAAPAPETTAIPTTQVPVTEPVTQPPTTVPPTEVPTETPTEAPTEPPAPTNPLTGETLEAPMETRFFAVSINNVPGAMPMDGVSRADLFFEMFVNDYCTRGLALFSDLSQVKSVGSVRSLRYNFTDLSEIYDAIVTHVSGSKQVLSDLAASGVDNVNVGIGSGYYYRDQNRLDQGYPLEHTMMIRGKETVAYAENRGIRITRNPEESYGLCFAEDGTPADGETADVVTIALKHGGVTKQTVMRYSQDQGKYLFCQYGYPVHDAAYVENIHFENVIVMLCHVYNDGVYHVAELTGSGEGYFACGGKIIPIQWHREQMSDPITFTLADGTPLELGVGSSYIAIAPLTSEVTYE